MADSEESKTTSGPRPMGPYGMPGMPGMPGRMGPGMMGPGMMGPGRMGPGTYGYGLGGIGWRHRNLYGPNDYGQGYHDENSFFDTRRAIRGELRKKYPKMSIRGVEWLSFFKAVVTHPFRRNLRNLQREESTNLGELAKRYH